jgi:predicted kinase
MEAVILSGLQGVGKSTFCHDRYRDTHVYINYDMLKTRRREGQLLSSCIEARLSFVVDATNPTAADRARYIAPSKRAAFRIIGIEFQASVEFALARNATRTGKARVPDVAIYATAKRLQHLAAHEGFDEIWIIRPECGGTRLVRLE